MSEGADTADDGLGLIREFCNGAVTRLKDGWRDLIHMEQLHLLIGGQERVTDAVLCLNHENSSYPTKLYFAENLGAGLNWNETAYMLGRQWHTYSWSGVLPNQPFADILAAHLAPLAKSKAA